MTDVPVDILLVEDDPNDGEMAVRAIRRPSRHSRARPRIY